MSYVEYDNLGIVEVRCMNCGIPIVRRNYKAVIIKSIPPKEVNVMTLVPLGCFRKKKYNIGIGTYGYVEVMLCSNCINLPDDPDKMEQAIEDGWNDTWKYNHRSKEETSKLRKSLPMLEGSKKCKKRKKQKVGKEIDELLKN